MKRCYHQVEGRLDLYLVHALGLLEVHRCLLELVLLAVADAFAEHQIVDVAVEDLAAALQVLEDPDGFDDPPLTEQAVRSVGVGQSSDLFLLHLRKIDLLQHLESLFELLLDHVDRTVEEELQLEEVFLFFGDVFESVERVVGEVDVSLEHSDETDVVETLERRRLRLVERYGPLVDSDCLLEVGLLLQSLRFPVQRLAVLLVFAEHLGQSLLRSPALRAPSLCCPAR